MLNNLPHKRISKLIYFYIYQNSPTLSPMPRNKFPSPITHSPLRRVSNYPIYISPLNNRNLPQSPNRVKTYRFQSNLSSSNDLKAINNMMKLNASNIVAVKNSPHDVRATMVHSMLNTCGAPPNANVKRASKRILQDDLESDSSQSNKTFCLNRKIIDIVSDRNKIISASSSANVSGTDDSNDSIQFNGQHGIGLSIPGLSRVSPVMGNTHESITNNYKPASPRLLMGMEQRKPVDQVSSLAINGMPSSAAVNVVE